jgi:hypothetical protein
VVVRDRRAIGSPARFLDAPPQPTASAISSATCVTHTRTRGCPRHSWMPSAQCIVIFAMNMCVLQRITAPSTRRSASSASWNEVLHRAIHKIALPQLTKAADLVHAHPQHEVTPSRAIMQCLQSRQAWRHLLLLRLPLLLRIIQQQPLKSGGSPAAPGSRGSSISRKSCHQQRGHCHAPG